MSHYDTLGVDKNASKEAIKRSYRKRAHKAHPDKGGNVEEFHAIQRAYDTLSDDAKRAHYDQTGQDQGAQEQDLHAFALAQIGSLFIQMLDKADIDHTNIVAEMRANIRNQRAVEKSQITEARRIIVKREKALKRIKHKGNGENLLAGLILGDIAARQRNIEATEKKDEVYEEMLKLLADYDYAADVMTARSQREAFAALSGGGWKLK